MPESELLQNRAPETRKVLAEIKGWALNWANTLIAVCFVLVVYGATQVRFSTEHKAQAQVQDGGSLLLVSETDLPGGHSVSFDWEGKTYHLTAREVGDRTVLDPVALMPDSLHGEIALRYREEVNLLKAIFAGIW